MINNFIVGEKIPKVKPTFYNAQTFIGNAIGSVLGQKVPDGCEIEYVLVDDKSQDNSRHLVENIINNTSKENFKLRKMTTMQYLIQIPQP